MGTIDEIIESIDNHLIESGKNYLVLGQANQFLESRGILTSTERSNKALKKLLESNKIPHAYQTETAPRQWIIPLSEKGIDRKIAINKQQRSKPGIAPKKSYQSQYSPVNYTNCPSCGISLSIPQEIMDEASVQCSRCGKNFRNPLLKQNYSNQLSKRQQTGLIRLIIFIVIVVLFIFFKLYRNEDSSSPLNLYYVNATTYAATSKANFDEMFSYVSENDKQALTSRMLQGQIVFLSAGTEVFLENAYMGYCIVRLRGSTENLWIATGKINKKD